jgi:monofunctional biosynthetic peptidoglycan transglycosylase
VKKPAKDAAPPPRKLRWLWRVLGAWVLVTVGPVLLFRFVDPPTTSFMLQRRWDAYETHEKGFKLRWQWVPLERISKPLQRALIAAEDQKFFEHGGFDVQAIEDAVEDRLEGKSTRGASTLTQQVAKNLFLWPGKSFVRKALEAYFTVLLELFWSKERILEVHLNVAEYGDGVYGVDQAARLAFGRSAAELGPEEASLLVVVLPAPKLRRIAAPTPKVKQRARWVVDQMAHITLR